MITVKSDIDFTDNIVLEKVETAFQTLVSHQGAGNEFLGWMDIDKIASQSLMKDIQQTADSLIKISDYVVVAGIGGSYLGARGVIEALRPCFLSKKPQIIYAGHHLSEDFLSELLSFLSTVDYSIIVISKSGTTTETAVAFRLLAQHCENKYGQDALKKRIVCITDKEKGALKKLADIKRYKSFVIPDNVGGRYSVLTPVGLLPIAVAGINIKALISGAKEMSNSLSDSTVNNAAVSYAHARNMLLNQGFNIEVMASFEPKLFFLIEWWKQLFGESEGKENKGIFPAGVVYTTDLHSMGQYMQEGQRIVFETFLSINQEKSICKLPHDNDNFDQLNYLAGKRISEINKQAKMGTILAHKDGGIPTIEILIDAIDEQNLGALIYFFEFACAISGYTLDVNPFNQPGVEAYKKNMFALLKKEGFEKEHELLQQRIHKTK
ncbi:MAG: glucose-6-phosphate isomerase [Bacteroidales bacterium]|jgi:glucose-6-phosphate isomerase|nr:glucose-6-phosphate isomerase [Bacteroidales bacterium]